MTLACIKNNHDIISLMLEKGYSLDIPEGSAKGSKRCISGDMIFGSVSVHIENIEEVGCAQVRRRRSEQSREWREKPLRPERRELTDSRLKLVQCMSA